MNQPDTILFLDDRRGIYIPRDFAQGIRHDHVANVTDEEWSILEDPDHDLYWDVWSDVCDNAIVTDDNGVIFRLYQDGALWLIPEGMDYDERTDSFFWAKPMRVTLSQSDDDNGMVTLYCDDQRQARLDQSVSLTGQSSRWECPRDMVVAYCSLMDHTSLLEELRADGYEVDDSEYSVPDETDMAYWSYKLECENAGEDPLDREAWLISREDK